MFARVTIIIFALVMMAMVIGPFTVRQTPLKTKGRPLKLELNRGTLTVLEFPSKKSTTTALLLFGSGDGGWGELEEEICRAFQNEGYEVIGIDCQAYANTDYDLDTLQSDFRTIAETVYSLDGRHKPPLIVGGYSMGATQAIAVAGGPHPPPGLIGLLLVDPCSRGRYGLHASDRMNFLPTGPGTYAVANFAPTLGSIRVVQWHAEDDSIDSRSWLDLLTTEHKAYIFPHDGHGYDDNREEFIRKLIGSVDWILSLPSTGTAKDN